MEFPVSEVVDLYPASLLKRTGTDEANAPQTKHVWWLAHTRPRQEKVVATALLARGVGYYLPLLTRKSLTRGRTRLARIPLFPGYVFVHGDENERLAALQTNRLITMQHVPDGDLLRAQLKQLAELIAAGVPLTRESRLVPGERVRIKAGPLRDIEGTVLRRNGKTEFLVSIDFLHQGASLEIDDWMLEVL